MTAVVVLLALAVGVLGVLVVGLLRTHAEILRRLSELGAGVYEDAADGTEASSTGGARSPVEIRTRPGVPEPRHQAEPVTATAFDVSGVTPDGSAVAAGVVGRDHTTLLAFLSSGCGTCADFWRAFGDGAGTRLPGRDTRLVIVTKGPTLESVSAVAALAPPGVTTVMSDAAYDDYRVPANPYFVLVDGPTGNVVGEGAAASWAQVANLLAQAAADAGHDLDAPLTPSAPAGRLTGPERSRRADDELRAAGIGPGHPSLYPDQLIADDEAPEAPLTRGGGDRDGRS
jgi:hypothetical protein